MRVDLLPLLTLTVLPHYLAFHDRCDLFERVRTSILVGFLQAGHASGPWLLRSVQCPLGA